MARCDKPSLSLIAQYYWQSFATLNNARQTGPNGPCSISLAEINNYCQLYSIRDTQERILIVRFTQALDRVFLKHYGSSMEA